VATAGAVAERLPHANSAPLRVKELVLILIVRANSGATSGAALG